MSPAAANVLVEAAGVLDAPIDRVADLMLTVRPGPVQAGNAWLFSQPGASLRGGPGRFEYVGVGHRGTLDVDRARGTVALQGGWWYRGEYELRELPDGVRVAHRVRNVARRGRWAVPLANRFFVGFGERTRAGFAATLQRAAAELGCGWRLAR